jgi:hypothetical protein
MRVRVDDARQHDAPEKVDHAGCGTYHCVDLLIRTDGDERVPSDREGLRNAARRIFGVDPAVQQYDVS